MGAPYFRFKQFTVWHDRCAMKVGTDGVLLGAWAGQERFGEIQGNHPRNILDIGTGSGLIALMLAQRFPQARITGIDCDKDAAMQAMENFTGSALHGQTGSGPSGQGCRISAVTLPPPLNAST